jgi:hypothetical protein
MKKKLPILLLLSLLLIQGLGGHARADELNDYINLLAEDKLLENDLCAPNHLIDRTITKSSLTDKDGKEFEVSMISYEYLEEVFKNLASQKHIPFRYPEDGCYARAHEMSSIMEQQKIISGKVFIEGSLRVETTNSPKGYVEWWYHVAPIVKVKKGKEELVYVLDPSLFDKPVPVEEWYKIQTKHQNPPKEDKKYYTTRFHYQPNDGEKTTYTDDDKQDVKQTMETYLKVQQERDEEKKKAETGGSNESK